MNLTAHFKIHFELGESCNYSIKIFLQHFRVDGAFNKKGKNQTK